MDARISLAHVSGPLRLHPELCPNSLRRRCCISEETGGYDAALYKCTVDADIDVDIGQPMAGRGRHCVTSTSIH